MKRGDRGNVFGAGNLIQGTKRGIAPVLSSRLLPLGHRYLLLKTSSYYIANQIYFSKFVPSVEKSVIEKRDRGVRPRPG